MPLRVHCPNRCLVRMPINRAGRVVRCPKCKSPIKIPEIPESALASGKPIPCHARIVRLRESEQVESANEIVADQSSDELDNIGPAAFSQTLVESNTEERIQPSRLPVPEVLKPLAKSGAVAAEEALSSTADLQKNQPNLPKPQIKPQAKYRAIDRVELPKPGTRTPVLESRGGVPSPDPMPDRSPSATPLLIDLGIGAGELSGRRSEKDWKDRLEKANADRNVLARFFALCLCIVSIVNMVPAFYHWYQWTQLVETMALPRWIYILIFVGAIHFVYAIFLAQISDWSALRAVSVAMLAIAFVFGFVSTGLLVGGGQGNLSSFLGISFTMNRQACIWCVAMLCLATLMSYWAGRESSNWQRAEHLLREILSTSTGQA